MTESIEKICKKCGRPKNSKDAGTLTQYLSLCNCDIVLEKSPDVEEERFCDDCGKKIGSGRRGSFTQFIFQSHLCACNRPVASEDNEFTLLDSPAFKADSEEVEDEALALSSDQFPTDRYKPLRKLGQGGSGEVYLAFDQLLRKRVGVKILHVLEPEMLIAFQEEAKATSRLEDPNIINILDFGITDSGIPYMVLENFEGRALSAILEEDGPLTLEECWIVFSQVCGGLSYAHEQGIYHRDVKPGNILIKGLGSDDVEVKIIDFGVAKVSELTGRGVDYQGNTLAGSPGYMAPDQVLGHEYDQRSEVYSIGCVLFEALTGKKPFEADSALELLSMHAHNEIPRLADHGVRLMHIESVQQIIDRCLAKDLNERFQSMDELMQAIEALFKEDSSVPESSFRHERRPGRKKNMAPLVVLFVLFSMPLILVIGYVINGNDSLETPKGSSEKDDRAKSDHRDPLTAASAIRNASGVAKSRVGGESSESSAGAAGEDLLKPRLMPVGRTPFQFYASGDWSDDDLKGIQKIRNLKGLSLKGKQITGAGLKHLTAIPLEGIDLSSTPVKDEHVKILAEIKTLKRIRLEDTGITDAAILSINTLPVLNYIDLKGTKVTDIAVGSLGQLKMLSVIDLRKLPNVRGESLEKLKGQKFILWLVLNGTKLSAEGCRQLGTLGNVRNVSLAYSGLDDNKVKFLKEMNVDALDISGNNITDRSLIELSRMKALKRLVVADCSKITEKGLKEFKSRRGDLPHCAVEKRLSPQLKFFYNL